MSELSWRLALEAGRRGSALRRLYTVTVLAQRIYAARPHAENATWAGLLWKASCQLVSPMAARANFIGGNASIDGLREAVCGLLTGDRFREEPLLGRPSTAHF